MPGASIPTNDSARESSPKQRGPKDRSLKDLDVMLTTESAVEF